MFIMFISVSMFQKKNTTVHDYTLKYTGVMIIEVLEREVQTPHTLTWSEWQKVVEQLDRNTDSLSEQPPL